MANILFSCSKGFKLENKVFIFFVWHSGFPSVFHCQLYYPLSGTFQPSHDEWFTFLHLCLQLPASLPLLTVDHLVDHLPLHTLHCVAKSSFSLKICSQGSIHGDFFYRVMSLAPQEEVCPPFAFRRNLSVQL